MKLHFDTPEGVRLATLEPRADQPDPHKTIFDVTYLKPSAKFTQNGDMVGLRSGDLLCVHINLYFSIEYLKKQGFTEEA